MNQIQTVKEIIWLSNLLNELQFFSVVKNNLIAYETSVYCLVVIIIYCDNQEAQALTRNLSQHARNKHIDIQQHFVKNKMQNDTLNLQHVFNDQQIVDDLTKSLFKNRFLKFRRDIDFMWSKNVVIWYFLDKSFLLDRFSNSFTRIHSLKNISTQLRNMIHLNELNRIQSSNEYMLTDILSLSIKRLDTCSQTFSLLALKDSIHVHRHSLTEYSEALHSQSKQSQHLNANKSLRTSNLNILTQTNLSKQAVSTS